MKIWVVIKSALNQHGEVSMATTERAFSDKAEAEKHIRQVQVAWTEVKDGINWFCERAVHETDLD